METAQGQWPLLHRLLDEVQRTIAYALKAARVDENTVEWTRMRSDMPDITAAWPKDRPARNIHAWLVGQWPRYLLQCEGAYWEDDEAKLERRVRFFAAPRQPYQRAAARIYVKGSVSQPLVSIANEDQFAKRMIELAEQIANAKLTGSVQVYPIKPEPDHRTQGGRGP